MASGNGVKHDDGKIDYSLLDDAADEELAAVLTYGAAKYGRDNWRDVERALDRYYAGMRRHMRSRRRGELVDGESGLLHVAHAVACLHFVLAFDATHPELAPIQDRVLAALARAREIAASRAITTEPETAASKPQTKKKRSTNHGKRV